MDLPDTGHLFGIRVAERRRSSSLGSLYHGSDACSCKPFCQSHITAVDSGNQEYKTALTNCENTKNVEKEQKPGDKRRHGYKASDDPLEPKTQGALLLQSMLHLSAPHHECVLNR